MASLLPPVVVSIHIFHTAIEQTDNSYVKGKTTILSSQINGYIKDVLVKDFDQVKQGQVLMHIDATTYDQKVTQAVSGVEQAENSLANQTQAIAQRQADVVAAQAKLDHVKAQYDLSIAQLKRYQKNVQRLLNHQPYHIGRLS